MRKFIAILLAKFGRFVGRLVGKGSSKPGYYALKADPKILGKIKLPPYVIAVSGSNGKTSTVEMIAKILSDAGMRVAYNKEGSNQIEGVATLILGECTLGGRMKSDVLLIESDERFARYTFRHFRPTHFVVTNLYRDQLTRNGHPEWVFDALKEGVKQADRLILNADDPLVSLFAEGRDDTVWFGCAKQPDSSAESDSVYDDGRFCPRCGGRMRYDYRIYNHVGSFRCPVCDYARRTPDYELEKIDLRTGSLVIRAGAERYEIPMENPSVYAAYNILAAFAAAREAGVPGEKIADTLRGFASHMGRIVSFALGGHEGKLLTSKHENSISYDQSIAVAAADPEEVSVLVIVDAVSRKYFTSETSWFWDIDFEKLASPNVRHIVLAGTHYGELAVRFSFTGIPEERIAAVRSLEEAAELLKSYDTNKIYTITCFSDKDKFLNLVERK